MISHFNRVAAENREIHDQHTTDDRVSKHMMKMSPYSRRSASKMSDDDKRKQSKKKLENKDSPIKNAIIEKQLQSQKV